MTEPFVGTIYVCNDCGGEMQSKYPGEFSSCGCGRSFVDQTLWYTRVGGNATHRGATLTEAEFDAKCREPWAVWFRNRSASYRPFRWYHRVLRCLRDVGGRINDWAGRA